MFSPSLHCCWTSTVQLGDWMGCNLSHCILSDRAFENKGIGFFLSSLILSSVYAADLRLWRKFLNYEYFPLELHILKSYLYLWCLVAAETTANSPCTHSLCKPQKKQWIFWVTPGLAALKICSLDWLQCKKRKKRKEKKRKIMEKNESNYLALAISTGKINCCWFRTITDFSPQMWYKVVWPKVSIPADSFALVQLGMERKWFSIAMNAWKQQWKAKSELFVFWPAVSKLAVPTSLFL